MTKHDLIDRISERTNLDVAVSRAVVESFFEVVKTAVSQGETIYVRQFGSFGPKQRAQKVARRIKAKTAITVAAHTIPYFKPSPDFIDQVRRLEVGNDPEKSTS